MKAVAFVAATFLAAVNAQFQVEVPGPNCVVVSKLKPNPGPFYMFEPGGADCGFGWAIPFGPVPTGCAKLEVLVGEFSFKFNCRMSFSIRWNFCQTQNDRFFSSA
jgi:hypothetical protein